jgi:predicted acyltransferase
VLFTGGLALQLLALCFWLIDIKGYRRWAKPFEILGVNAIALYVGAGLMAALLGLIKVTGADGTKIPLGDWIYNNLFASWASPINASLAFAIVFVLVWLALMWMLFRRNIFIKV